MLCCNLIIRKGLLVSELAIDSLENINNIFNLADFLNFMEMEEHKDILE